MLHLGQLREKKSRDLHENPSKVSKYDGVYTVLYIIDHFEWFLWRS